MKIALATYTKQAKFEQGVSVDEDTDLWHFLKEKGLDVELAIWNDPEVDWKRFDTVIIKSTWDYHDQPEAFLAWMDRLENQNIQLLNSRKTVAWNYHKKYLGEVADQTLPVIPSRYLDRGSDFDPNLFDDLKAEKIVVKPCVSAGADNTWVIERAMLNQHIQEVNRLSRERDLIVQPFLESIRDGEWSFIFFNGVYSHCALKTPKQGDFRVQHHHGGSVSFPTADTRHIAQAKAYLHILPDPTLYARIDGVILDGSFVLMEMELIEPYLFLNSQDQWMENFYQALVQMTKIL